MTTSLQTDDISVLSDSFRAGPVDYIQTGRGHLNARMFATRSTRVEVREVSFQAATLLTSESVFPRFAIGIALGGNPLLMEKKLTDSNLGFVNGTNGLIARHAPGSAWCNLAIDHQFLREVADIHGYAVPDGDGSCELPRSAKADFASALSQIARSIRGASLVDLVFEDEIALLVLRTLNPQRKFQRSNGAVHWQTARRVIEYVHTNYGQPITLSEVCVYAGVGERTLRYHFRKACGLGVQQYLMGYRLHRGRDILSKRQVATVAEAARLCGIPDAGRFAQYFRALFGVLPREVLK